MNNAGVDFHVTKVTADDRLGQITVATQARLNDTVLTRDYQIDGFAASQYGLAKALASFTPSTYDFYPSEITKNNFAQNFDVKYPSLKTNSKFNYHLESLTANDAEGSLTIEYQISLIVDNRTIYSPVKTAVIYGLKVNHSAQTTQRLNRMVRQLSAEVKTVARNYYPSQLLSGKLSGAIKNSNLTG